MNAVQRVINVLGERQLYSQDQIRDLHSALGMEKPQKPVQNARARLIRQYEAVAEDRLKMRADAIKTAVENMRAVMNPPSADSDTRKLIATYPDSIGIPTSVRPKNAMDAMNLLKQANEAHSIVSEYSKKVSEEEKRTKLLCKHLEHLDVILEAESRLDHELIEKARAALNSLKEKKRSLLEHGNLLPDEPKPHSSRELPELYEYELCK